MIVCRHCHRPVRLTRYGYGHADGRPCGRYIVPVDDEHLRERVRRELEEDLREWTEAELREAFGR